jgi:hypothetical protein
MESAETSRGSCDVDGRREGRADRSGVDERSHELSGPAPSGKVELDDRTERSID